MNTTSLSTTSKNSTSTEAPTYRTVAREFVNPVDYKHPHTSMAQFANLLALSYDANGTRHAYYYRHIRILHAHFSCDPATLTEAQLRDYFLFVKLKKRWKPKTIRQTVAATRLFFVDLLHQNTWTLFSQIRVRDHDTLPAILTREQVRLLLDRIRLRRYRTPLKLIYCCGLRLSECLGLTIHDIQGKENKLIIRNSKGHKDRVVPLPTPLWQALRVFLPEFLKNHPDLSTHQRRAIRAITQCRTPALGGRVFACNQCGRRHFAYHSCNHKACPQCGREATRAWVQRELAKRLEVPYFLLTFTLPSQLRALFLGAQAKEAFDLFFAAVSGALREKLASDRGLRAEVSGFTAALHTWNQKLLFHPHIHCLVPGAGLNSSGQAVRVKTPDFLIFLPHLQGAFRQHMRRLLDQKGWQVDPIVWSLKWGVHIQPVGTGETAIKYLGNYVARSAISDSRIQAVTHNGVRFRWRDRAEQNRAKTLQVTGVEFLTRYFRHVLPVGLRSVRYYGFCHPTAKANRLRIQLGLGSSVELGDQEVSTRPTSNPPCPFCEGPTCLVGKLGRGPSTRGPPQMRAIHPTPSAA